jgi:hypothetical protein
MNTSTTLKVHEMVLNMGYFDFSDELWFDMDSNDSYTDELTIGCKPETVVQFMRNFVVTYLLPNNQLNKKGGISKLTPSQVETVKQTMTKLYDYFNQEDA